MKSTGMTRRIDELGRIVIPKEIRRNLRLSVGEELEIFVEQETLMMKRFSAMASRKASAYKTAEILKDTLGASVLVTDTDKIIASACTELYDYDSREISFELKEVYAKRELLVMQNCSLPICKNDPSCFSCLMIAPLLSSGELFGGLAIFKTQGSFNEKDKEIAQISAKLLANELCF